MMFRKSGSKRMLLCLGVCILILCAGALILVRVYKPENTTEKENAASKENFTELVVGIPFSGISEEDLSLMEEEVNKITKEKLQIKVSFLHTDSYSNTVNLMLNDGKQLDIIMASGNMFDELYIKGSLIPMDDLLEEYGKGILKELDKNMISSCDFQGRTYGIPTIKEYATGTNAYMFRKDLLEKYNIDYKDIKSIKDMEKVFEIIKEKEPGMTVLESGGGTMLSNLYFSDLMSGYFRPGVHMDYGRDEKISNVFETKEYYDALKRIRRWYLKGYLNQNPLGETESLFARVRAGKVFAYTTKWKPGVEVQDSSGTGYEMVCVQLGKTANCYNVYSRAPYVITKNSISKEKSMQLLNLFYTDEDLMNTMSYGVEGVHYKKTSDGHFTSVDKENGDPFTATAWKVPNQLITGIWEGNKLSLWDDVREFNKNAIQSCDIGFIFDVRSVITEYYTLKNIYFQYRPILENGLVNPEDGLSDMLDELNENGLSDVLDEERRQFELWQNRYK